MSPPNVLIIGATSAIAQSCARLWARQSARLFLVGRNPDKLASLQADLRVRGAAEVHTALLDVNDFDRHRCVLEEALSTLGTLDIVLIAHGMLTDQRRGEQDIQIALHGFNTNALSVIALLTWLGNEMEVRRHGVIAVISSVAGDRGRQSNYIYGSAKGMLTIFLQGLRNRLFYSGVHVLTIKPGLVKTPMTANFRQSLMWASPDEVAKDIYIAIRRRKDVLYTPWFWRPVMQIITHMPEFLFKKKRL